MKKSDKKEADMLKPSQEFEVQQIEMLMQREALSHAKAYITEATRIYTELSDISPIGYFTLAQNSEIVDISPAGAKMLGKDQQSLIKESFDHYISPDTTATFHKFLEKLFQSKSKESCEITFSGPDSKVMDLRLNGIMARNVQHCFVIAIDITRQKREKTYRDIGREVLQILNDPGELEESMTRILRLFKEKTNFDAVGIRLQQGDDFPYFVQEGFSKDFLETEDSVIEHSPSGKICRDENGKARLECNCGLVIAGKPIPDNPNFTGGGSYWTATPATEQDSVATPASHTKVREECMRHAYVSTALIPIRNKDHIVGMIHLNDRRKGCFSLEIVEMLEGIASHIGTALMRMQAEQQLRDNERILHQAQEVSRIGHYVTDIKSGSWTSSPVLDEIFGIDHNFVRNIDSWSTLIIPEHRQLLLDYYHQVIRDKTRFDMSYQVIRPLDGQLRWVSALGQIDFDAAGEAIRQIGTIQDITAQKEAAAAHEQHFLFTKASNKIAEVIIANDDAAHILDNTNRILGETLALDRALIYDVSFKNNRITALCEWMREDHPDIIATKGDYNTIAEFSSPLINIWESHTYLESHTNAVNQHFITDATAGIIHDNLRIKSLIWYPFAFSEEGFHLFTLNNIVKSRVWSAEEIDFLESVAKQISLAMMKIRLIEESKRAEEELKNSVEQLHQLTHYIEKVREEERVAISRELHDDLGQALTAVKIELGILNQGASDDASVLKIQKITSLVSDTIKTVQRITAQLRPEIIDDLGLADAIEWYAREFAERNGLKLQLNLDTNISLSPDASLNIFRIVQESLTNIARHAQASRIRIALRQSSEHIELKITDNGQGISEHELSSRQSFGIISMKERSANLGGTFHIHSDTKSGTTINLSFPAKRQTPA